MRKSAVVVAGMDLQPPDQVLGLLKRHLLMFDEIVVGEHTPSRSIRLAPSSPLRGEIDWLIDWLQERGLIRSALVTPASIERVSHKLTLADVTELQRHLVAGIKAGEQAQAILDAAVDGSPQDSGYVMVPANIYEVVGRAMSPVARVTATILARQEDLEVFPILPALDPGPEHSGRGLEPAVRVVAELLPAPDGSTAWEAILDFRSDPDARHRLVALRRWMRSLAAENRSAHDIEDELLYLIGEYESSMRLHRLKYKRGVMEMVITTGASIVEDLVRLRFGRAAQAIFSIRRERVHLLEAERTAPGREVSFIVEAAARFAPRR
jgi:hypothetical protein